MTIQHDPQENDRFESEIRRAAEAIHPRAAFVQGLRRELSARPLRRDTFTLRRYLPQAAALAALTALVVLALVLTPDLVRAPEAGPAAPETAAPGQPREPGGSGLPNGALARLGQGQILSLDTAADGRLAVGSTLGICVYDAGYTPLWCQEMGTPYGLGWLAFNPAGDRLAVVLSGDTVTFEAQVLDAANGNVLAAHPFPPLLLGYPYNDAALAWDPSGQPRLALPTEDGALIVWDWQANTTVWGPLDVSEVTGGEGSPVRLDWALDAQGRSRLAAGNRGLLLLDGETGQPVARLNEGSDAAPTDNISALDLSPDGQWLAYGYPNGAALLRLEGDQVTSTLTWGTEYQPMQVLLGPESSGMRLAVEELETVTLFSVQGDEPPQTFPAGYSPLAWVADGALFYARPDGMLGAFENGEERVIPAQYTGWPERIAWGGDEVIALRNNTVTRWNAAIAELGAMNTVSGQNPDDLAITADGARAAYYLNGEDAVQVWDTANHQALSRLEPVDFKAQAAFSADGSRLLTIDRSGKLTLWDANTGQALRAVEAAPPDTQVDALALSPDGRMAALGRVDQGEPRLDLWDLENGRAIARIPTDTNVQALAWSPDGRWVAAAESGRVRIWDTASGRRVQTMGTEPYEMARSVVYQGPRNHIGSLAWSPDGKILAAGGGLVTLWDVAQGLPLRAFGGHRGLVHALAFRADGLALASASADGTILVWDAGAGPQPTAEPLPTSTPLPLETDTPAPSGPPDLGTYEVSQTYYHSPDGEWTADVLFAQAQPGSPRQENYHRLVVRKRDGGAAGQNWTYEQWTDAAQTRTGWSEMKWDDDAVYWYENVSRLDACHADWSTNLRRMDATTGEVTSVPGFGPDWQGRLAFSPDTPEFAHLDGAALVVRGLDGAERQRIPFEPIAGSWGARGLFYQPLDYGVVMIQHTPANLMCDGGPVLEGVVVFQVKDGTALQREIPKGYQFRGYDVSGVVDLLGPDDKLHLLDLHSGALKPAVLAPGEEQAGRTLWDFLAALAGEDYDRAAPLYGGSLELDGQTFADAAALLRYACESGGYLCRVPVKQIMTNGERDGFRFAVIYTGEDGEELMLDGQSMSDFQVKANGQGQYQVMNLPPRPRAVDALIQFIDLLAEASRGDPALFDQAAALYAGTPRMFDPRKLTGNGTADLLRQACSEGVTGAGPALCLKPLAVRLGEPIRAERARLWLQFERPEGGAWEDPVAGPWYPFTLLRGADGLWRVADLPPAQYATTGPSAHLTGLETAGLDDVALLRALWQDGLEQATSPYQPERSRLAAYEIHEITLDPQLDRLKTEFNLDAVGRVRFSVRPVVIQSDWQAGNGRSDGEWVRDKSLIIGVVQENGASHLVVIGTGP